MSKNNVFKEPIRTFFSTDEIDKQTYKVVSTRSLDYEYFAPQLKLLMEQCYEKGRTEGMRECTEIFYNHEYYW